MAYAKELKEAALDKMLNTDLSLRYLSEELGIPRGTLHGWKRKYLIKEDPDMLKPLPENWTPEEKFAVVLHTATLTEVELNTYCRENGLYPAHVKAWRLACIRGNDPQDKNLRRTAVYREDKRKILALEQELKYKEKALAEAAALLVLKKKFEVLWKEDEDG